MEEAKAWLAMVSHFADLQTGMPLDRMIAVVRGVADELGVPVQDVLRTPYSLMRIDFRDEAALREALIRVYESNKRMKLVT